MTLTVLLTAALAVSEIVVTPIETSGPGAVAYFAAPQRAAPARLIVLDGYRLRLFNFGATIIESSVLLPPETRVVDIADLDKDGAMDAVIVRDRSVDTRPIEDGGVSGDWRTLFEVAAEFGLRGAAPRRIPIIREFEGKFVLSIPTKSAITHRNLDGTLVEDAAQLPAVQDLSLTRRIVAPPQAGPADSLEFLVHARESLASNLSASDASDAGRLGTVEQMRHAGDGPPLSWPWFPLERGAGASTRVLYALNPPAYDDTLIRIWPIAERAEPGSQRRYPGVIIPPDEPLFDANGDGLRDLVLWKTPSLGVSIAAISRAIRRSDWRVQLTVHLFDPERGLYSAQPAGQIAAEIPVAWFVQPFGAHPLRNLLMTDLDGDGSGDIAMSQSQRSLDFWMYDEGFPRRPSHSLALPSAQTRIADMTRPNAYGGALILLRDDEALYVARVPAAP